MRVLGQYSRRFTLLIHGEGRRYGAPPRAAATGWVTTRRAAGNNHRCFFSLTRNSLP